MAEQTLFDCASPVKEEWRTVVGFENYEVSNTGRVRRALQATEHWSTARGLVLRQHEMNRGYLTVSFWRNGKQARRLVHRVVTEAFIGPLSPGHDIEVNHRDGNKKNNRVGNLEVVTSSQNKTHAYALGLYPIGEKHYSRLHPELIRRGEASPKHRFTEADVREIRRLVGSGLTMYRVARMYGVHDGTVQKIVYRQRWKHVA